MDRDCLRTAATRQPDQFGDDGHLHLVVDLSEVVFLDSTGLGVLIDLLHRLRSRDGSLVLAGAKERVYKVFHTTQLTKALIFTDTIDDAINSGTAGTRNS